MAATRDALAAVLLASALVSLAVVASAQTPAEAVRAGATGDQLFKTYCASCHGLSAKGDGPVAASLRYQPADLTLVRKHNGGKFDAGKIYGIIDGREPVKGHGGTDMPVWGDAFKSTDEGYTEKAVKARIQALIEYLKSIQAK
jgi:mono/diheme cytochrome c family protein